jgi:L-alanine-DL-glutamate epimerase-like enolase superfamily enzyme
MTRTPTRKPAIITILSLLSASLPLAAHPDVAIQGVRLLEFQIPRTTAFVTSKGSTTSCDGIFVLIDAADENGKSWTAVGECLPKPSVTSENADDGWAGAQSMREFLLGKRLGGADLGADMETIRGWLKGLHDIATAAKITWESPPADPAKYLRGTLSGFDLALLDLVGRVHDKPLYELLGGKRRPAVTLSAPTLNADIPPEDVPDAVAGANRTYRAARLKIGTDDELDMRRIAAAATALVEEGRSRELWVDVNQAWKTTEHSIRMLERVRGALAQAGFTSRFICEQPTAQTDIEALARVTRQTRRWHADEPPQIVVMADEAMWTLDDAKRIAATDAADLVNIKVVKAGGLLASVDIANHLREHAPHIGIYIGGLMMTDIAATARLHLAHALPRLDYVTGCFPRSSYAINPATSRLLYRSGTRTLVQPKGPGLGTGVSLETLEPYIVRAVP